MPPILYSQCPICGQTGGRGWSLRSHYTSLHPEFDREYRQLNSYFVRVSVVIILVLLGFASLVIFGLTRWLILFWGWTILAWFSYLLLFWQPTLDGLSDRYNDTWRNGGKTSTLDQVIDGSPKGITNSSLCQICRQGPYRLGLGLRYHLRLYHAEYFEWYQKWIRQIEKGAIITVLLLVSLFPTGFPDTLTNSAIGPLILFVPALALVSVFAIGRARKQKQRRQSWLQTQSA